MNRYTENGLGLHPKKRYDSSHIRFWSFDNTQFAQVWGNHANGATTQVLDSFNGIADPTIKKSLVGAGRVYDNTPQTAPGSAGVRTAITDGEFTFSMWIKPLRYASSPTARELLVAVWGDNAITSAAESGLFAAAIRDTGQISLIWEDNGASTGGWRDTDAYVRLNRWYKIDFVSAPNGANLDLSIYINGERADFLENVQRSAGGSNSDFYVGGIKQGVSSTLRGNFEMCGLYFFDSSLTQEDIIEDFRRGFLGDVSYQESAKAEIEDQSATFVDVSNIDGVDAFGGFSTSENVDTQTQTLTLSLARDNGRKSMSPLRTDSLHNLSDKADPLSFSEIIRKGAGVKVSTARSAWGIEPETDDFIEIFDGQIVTASFSSDPISVECADNSTVLVNTFIEGNYAYGGATKNSDGATLPSPTLVPLEDVIQGILDDNDDTTQDPDRPGLYGSYQPITITVDEDPSYALSEYVQRREPVYSAISTLADQIGWVVRYRYRNDLSDWALTLYDPIPLIERRGYVIGKKDILEITNADIDSVNVRNSVKIIYGSQEPFSGPAGSRPDINTSGLSIPGSWVASNGNSGPDTHGNKTPAFVLMENRDSIDLYGRMHSEISEDATSQIDTVVEAGRLAISFLESLSEPLATIDVKIPYSPHYEIGDKVLIEGGNQVFTDNQDLAIVSLSHAISGEESTTTLSMRGKPSSGFKKWFRLEARPGIARPGTQLGDQSLPDRRRGDLISSTRSQYENSDQFTGGKYLNVRNQDFQLMTRGDRYEPDGWSSNNWWNYSTTSLAISPSTTNTLSGTQALEFGALTSPTQTDGGVRRGLKSDLVPIKGGTTPYSFECAWIYTTAGATNMGVDLLIEWYGGDKLTLLGTTQVGGASPSFSDRVGVNNWHRSRVDGIRPPSTSARFLRILIGCAFGASTSCYVDSVSGYQTANSITTYFDYDVWPTSPGIYLYQTLTERLIAVSTTGTTSNPAGFEGFDYGGDFTQQYGAAPGSEPGWYFEVPEDGTYDIAISSYLQSTSSLPAGTINYPSDVPRVNVWADANYSYTSPEYDYSSGGTLVYSATGQLIESGRSYIVFREYFSAELRQGQKISATIDNVSPAPFRTHFSSSDNTNISIKLRRAD